MGRVPSCSKWVPEELLMLLNLWVRQESRRMFPKQADNKINKAIDNVTVWRGRAATGQSKWSGLELEDWKPGMAELPWRTHGNWSSANQFGAFPESEQVCFSIFYSILWLGIGIIASFPQMTREADCNHTALPGSLKALAIYVFWCLTTQDINHFWTLGLFPVSMFATVDLEPEKLLLNGRGFPESKYRAIEKVQLRK